MKILIQTITLCHFFVTVRLFPTENVNSTTDAVPLINSTNSNSCNISSTTTAAPTTSVTLLPNGTAIFNNGTVLNDHHREPKILALLKLLAAELLGLDGLGVGGAYPPQPPFPYPVPPQSPYYGAPYAYGNGYGNGYPYAQRGYPYYPYAMG